MANDGAKTGTVARRVETFHTRMIERARMTTDRAAEVMATQGERILSATTVDEIWDADAGGTIQGRDVADTVWEIRGYQPVLSNRTDLENTRGYYMSCDAVYLGGPPEITRQFDLTIGEVYALQTGADLVMYKLAMFDAAKQFPIKVMFKSIPTQKGKLLKLVRPPEMAQSGETG